MQKAKVELLMNDYIRKGFIDGRSLRLPTIAIRPGKPNAATSSFVSSIIREPLHGKSASYPVPSETKVWIQSPKRIIQNFIHAANIDEKRPHYSCDMKTPEQMHKQAQIKIRSYKTTNHTRANLNTVS
jgi:nucleoside-diphosphate-sugar epimerase